MINDNEPVTERNPSSMRCPCWQQELRSASAEAQRATGEVLVLLGQLAEQISQLGIALVRIAHATELASQEQPNVTADPNVPTSG
jgi:hypothetical protein